MPSKTRSTRSSNKGRNLTTEEAGRMGGRKVAELIERGKESEGSSSKERR